jgi:conjugative relaxase-like TrwC/TraI family protein
MAVYGSDNFSENTPYRQKHCERNDYYEKGKTVQGHWVGKGCALYGVEPGSVVSDEFDRLKLNRHPETGLAVTRHVKGRKPFCDVSIGAPKTWSIAAVTGRSGFALEGHRVAASKVTDEMERLIGRQAHDGKNHVERTGLMAAALYEHDTNRCLEPHVHTHVVILNMTRGSNGKDYAIEFRELISRSNYLTQVYNNALGEWAARHGADVTYDEHGAPQLTALLDLKAISQRRSDQIRALVEEVEGHAGTTLSNREAKQIALACRGLDVDEFKRIWEAEKGDLAPLRGLDPETAEADRRKLLLEFTRKVWRASKSDLIETTAEEVRENQRSVFNPEQLDRVMAFQSTVPGAPCPDRELRSFLPDLEFAIEHLFSRRTVVRDYELYEEVLKHAQGVRVDLEALRSAVGAHPDLACLRGEVTTLAHLTRELGILTMGEDGRGRGKAVLTERVSEKLSAHQAGAVRSLLGCQDQFMLLDGASGVGKTTSLADVISANLAAGHRVAVVAPSDGARNVLRKEVEKLLEGELAPGTAQVFEAAASLQLFQTDPKLHNRLGAGDLLILDEASEASVQQVYELKEWATRRGVRLLEAGDKDQHTSVEAGDALRLQLKYSTIHRARLHEIRRQSPDALEGHYLEAVKLFKVKKSTKAFRELYEANRLLELRGQARVESVADLIVRFRDQGKAALASNPTHRENDAISEAVRDRLTARGELSEERTLAAHRSLGWTVAQKREVNRLVAGQILEIVRGPDKGKAWTVTEVQKGKAAAVDASGQRRLFGREHAGLFDVCERRELKVAIGDTLLTRSGTRSKRGDIVNGEVLQVAGWDADGNPVASDGRSIVGRNLTHGYASTTHRVEGATSLECILGFDRHSVKHASQKVAYVGASRGVQGVTVFVESIADLSQIEDRAGDRKGVSEMDLEAGEDPRSNVQALFARLQQIKRAADPAVREQLLKEASREGAEPHARGVADLQAGAIKTAPQEDLSVNAIEKVTMELDQQWQQTTKEEAARLRQEQDLSFAQACSEKAAELREEQRVQKGLPPEVERAGSETARYEAALRSKVRERFPNPTPQGQREIERQIALAVKRHEDKIKEKTQPWERAGVDGPEMTKAPEREVDGYER